MTEDYKLLVEKLGAERIKVNEPMDKHTTFRIGGPADLFYEAKTTGEIVKAITICRDLEIDYFVLGGGSNLLVSDKGIRGLVIKISNYTFQVLNNIVLVGAGVNLSDLVQKAGENSLAGLEFLVGIPGTIGGAIVGNAGAWQQSVGDEILRVLILDEEGKTMWLENIDCGFDYRTSRFKSSGEIILEAEFQLDSGKDSDIRKKMKDFLNKRSGQPKEPSAGCIFVNPKPIPAGTLIDQCGLKGKKEGGAMIAHAHANFIVNFDQSSSQDILKLIDLIKKSVKEKFGVRLVEEIEIIGDL